MMFFYKYRNNMDTGSLRELIELERRRNEIYAKWVKEVALLVLAAIVVHKIATGVSLADPVVVVSGIISLLLYYQAKRLIEKT